MPKAYLHPDLQPFVVTTEVGQMVQHPLVHTLYFGTAQETEWLNVSYEQKSAALEKALHGRDWDYAVALVERPYRVDMLSRIPRETPGYWGILAAWWADTEFPHTRKDAWLSLFDHPDAHDLMGEMDRETFDALPSEVPVYRGIGPLGDPEGLSWTVSRDKAEWFAQRFAAGGGGGGHVVARTIEKSRITAYLDRRNEQEVIILPRQWR